MCYFVQLGTKMYYLVPSRLRFFSSSTFNQVLTSLVILAYSYYIDFIVNTLY